MAQPDVREAQRSAGIDGEPHALTPARRLVSLLGIGGVAIGFAFKDIFQNMLAGVLILLREPFRVGDEITAGDFTGTVEDRTIAK